MEPSNNNPTTRDPAQEAAAQAHLVRTPQGLCLQSGDLSLRADFATLLPRVKPSRLGKELLVKAANPRAAKEAVATIGANAPADANAAAPLPLAIDATAGLGEDSFLLAAAGFQVIMFERDKTIAALLQDALARATQDETLAPVARRMQLRQEDSIAALRAWNTQAQQGQRPSVVLLDPMFPARTKSAAVKKKFQLIHLLEQPCADENELLAAALQAAPARVVVKRPPRGPYLANVKPSYSLTGKAVRYDVLIPAQMNLAKLNL